MNQQQEQLEAIRDIRNLMERSSRFLSLSGLAGVIVGIFAIACIVAVYLFLGLSPLATGYYNLLKDENGGLQLSTCTFLAADFGLVLLLSLFTGVLMAVRKARKQSLPVWDATARRMLLNMAIPLVAGGMYCLVLLYHGQVALVAPASLLFYGMALLNASKYTINDIRYLGVLELVLGLLASFFIDYGLLFWAFGFGILHIVYGITIYFTYEK
ncbi:MAG: hypothetical protein HYU71_11250 [Bacteroidetes bacterium]|nr:hypothetical protein [Bacteroidota bacterium]